MSERREAGLPEYGLSDFRPGMRVRTKEGPVGTVEDVLEAPNDTTVWVTLDGGLGGGQYGESELTPLSGQRAATVERIASDDYPELGSILTDRPDHRPSISADEYFGGRVASRQAPTGISAAASSLLEGALSAVAAAKVHCAECGQDYFADSEDEFHKHADLYLPPNDPEPVVDASPGYKDGFEQAQHGAAREPGSNEAQYRSDFDLGWADGVALRAPVPEEPLTDPSSLDTDGNAPRMGSLLAEAGGLWDLITNSDRPSSAPHGFKDMQHLPSYDWCRFRKNSRCMYPKELNKEATKEAGYAVWVPEDRGYCDRNSWENQQKCPVGEPGPNVPGGYTDATVPWEEGGQHGGSPRAPYRSAASLDATASASELGFHLTAAWKDVRAKAKRIRSEGGVKIVSSIPGAVTAQVQGEEHRYQTVLTFVPGKYAVGAWECGCPWAAYSWGRTGPWKKYEGRMCSHALATVYEAQSRGMFGKEVKEDHDLDPAWHKDTKVPGDWDRDTGRYAMLASVEDEGVPAHLLVQAMAGESVALEDIVATLEGLGVPDPAPVVVTALHGKVRGKVNGRVVNLSIVDGVIVLDGHPVTGPILYPTYDPRLGMDFHAHASMAADLPSLAEAVEENTLHEQGPLAPSGATAAFLFLADEVDPADPSIDDPGGETIGEDAPAPDDAIIAYGDEDGDEDEKPMDALAAHEAVVAGDTSVKDPHAWLKGGGNGDKDVAAAAKAYLAKTSLKDFSPAERAQIIAEGEGVRAGNFEGLQLEGTHYLALEERYQNDEDDSPANGWM